MKKPKKRFYQFVMNEKSNDVKLLEKCQHIGEVKLFNHILRSMNITTMTWYNTKQTRAIARDLLKLGDSTIALYLKNLESYGILKNPAKSIYVINEEYLQFIKE